MKIKEALDKLYSMHKFGVKLGLENITRLLEHLGNPQNSFQSIHIAGSNGKGSTASFTASVLTEAGMKTGLYTSPHFMRFNERVRINGEEIPDEYIAEFISDLSGYIDEHKPTFFEITTALAFKYFADNSIDVGVIETGLGGRLDATNTIVPLASVITTISYEHTNILGETLEEIAAEKAGIIKPRVPVFTGILKDVSYDVIRTAAGANDCEVYNLKERLEINNDRVKLSTDKTEFTIYSTPLRGSHQRNNSALALFVCSEIFKVTNESVLRRGIKNVVKNTGIQGRYEVYCEEPKIIFDSAHNEEGVDIFLEEFKKERNNYESCSVIFGAMTDKNLRSMLKKLSGVFDNIFATSIDYERAASIENLKSIAESVNVKVKPMENAAEFIKRFGDRKSAECLCILGSIYILGEIKDKLSN